MVTIIGLCGSLRNGPFNRMLLHTAVELCPPGMTIEPDSIGEIPLYDTDVEEQGMPRVVQRLKDRIAEADGLLIATPEYNNSIPGVLKDAIDWLSRPAEECLVEAQTGRATARSDRAPCTRWRTASRRMPPI